MRLQKYLNLKFSDYFENFQEQSQRINKNTVSSYLMILS